MARKTVKLSKPQQAYAIAKALYQTACENLGRDSAAIRHLEETDIDQWAIEYEMICDKHNTSGLFKQLHAAETAMIEWANTEVAKHPAYAKHAETIAFVMKNINRPSVRAQLVDMAFRLSPTPTRRRRAR